MSVGLEVLYATVSKDIKSKEDALVCFLHWCIIGNGYKNIGSSPNVDENVADLTQTELLPSGWNDNEEIYTLKYVNDKQEVCLIRCLKTEGTFIVDGLNVTNNKTSTLNLNTEEFINDCDLKEFKSVFKDVTQLKDKITTSVFSILTCQFTQPRHQEQETNTESDRRERERRFSEDVYRERARNIDSDWDSDLTGPPPIGTGDLDPLGRGGGGMLMDPRNMPGVGYRPPRMPYPNLPRGAVPPGARFDPFGPQNPHGIPGRGRGFAGPNPDHLPPPPDYDDMFM